MHVTRLGLTPLKGTRHAERSAVELAAHGPDGDRVFCLVDPGRERVVRTVEAPTLMSTRVDWDGTRLTARLPGARASGVPRPTGRRIRVDYWGRGADLEVVEGPWADAFGQLLGHEVLLARTSRAGEVVYAGPVSLVTSSSMRRLAEASGHRVDPAAFRATVAVDTGTAPPHVEDGWAGRRLRLGEAEVEVRGPLPRCAVVDRDPVSGERAAGLLTCLGGYRRVAGQILFGVDAVVTRPGRVVAGDPVEVREARLPLGRG